jgi:hypothetical protein
MTGALIPTPDTLLPPENVQGAMVQTACNPDPTAIYSDEPQLGNDPDLWLYRDRTIGMLRRYMRLSVEVGRLPSLLGREFFRTGVTSDTVSTFEDAVIFVHDVARSLAKLEAFDKLLIAKIILQDHTQYEAARLLNCGRRTVVRRFPEAVDRITESFLEGGLLTRLPTTTSDSSESCQEGKTDEKEVSDCKDGK